MKRLFINLFAILTLLTSPALAKDIKFVQVTDVHYALNNDFSQEVLEQAVNDINKIDDVSFVIFTGDNINRP